nr:hypothetical protein CFP56_11906 [Quercus suber]
MHLAATSQQATISAPVHRDLQLRIYLCVGEAPVQRRLGCELVPQDPGAFTVRLSLRGMYIHRATSNCTAGRVLFYQSSRDFVVLRSSPSGIAACSPRHRVDDLSVSIPERSREFWSLWHSVFVLICRICIHSGNEVDRCLL